MQLFGLQTVTQLRVKRGTTIEDCRDIGVAQLIKAFSPSPDWLVWLVADVEAPPLELNDVPFLQALQTGIPEHLLLRLEITITTRYLTIIIIIISHKNAPGGVWFKINEEKQKIHYSETNAVHSRFMR